MKELLENCQILLEKYEKKYENEGLSEKEADEIVGLKIRLKGIRIYKHELTSEEKQLLKYRDSLERGFEKLRSALHDQGAYNRFTYDEIDYIRENSDLLSFLLYEKNIGEMVSAYNEKRKDIFRFYTETSYAFLCNFHNEKTASLGVTTHKGLFHCFGCGATGDIFKYVMINYNLSFKNAVQLVANIFMIRLHDTKVNESELVMGIRNTFLSKKYEYLLEERKKRNSKQKYYRGFELYNKELRDRMLDGAWDNSLVRKGEEKKMFKKVEDNTKTIDINYLTEIPDDVSNIENGLLTMGEIKEVAEVKAAETILVKDSTPKIVLAETNKPKVALFVCDIQGTITVPYSGTEEIKYKEFISLLDKLRMESNADELIFSHSTGDERSEYLFKYVEKMKSYLNEDSISLGYQHLSGYGIYDSNNNLIIRSKHDKLARIIDYVNELSEEKKVVFVGFADDNITSRIIEILKENIPFVENVYGFIPGDKNVISDLVSRSDINGIDGLIKTIDNYLNECATKINESDYIEESSCTVEHVKTKTLSL